MSILRYTEFLEVIYLTSIMKEEIVKSQKISTDDLLEYYWNNEPIYHPEFVKPMAPNSVKKNRILSFVLLMVYMSFTGYLLQISTNSHIISWIFGLICGAFVADFISGCAHIFIDFMPSTKKTSLHKQLFLSRVHHHELFRPARLNIPSLWFSPALYALFLIVILPFLFIKFVFSYSIPDWIFPFWLFLLWLTSISQITHAVAHGKGSNSKLKRALKYLQKFSIIISAKKHSMHHRNIDRDFCVLNGWANPFLNFIFKTFIENKIPESTAVGRQIQDLGKKLSYPYRELL